MCYKTQFAVLIYLNLLVFFVNCQFDFASYTKEGNCPDMENTGICYRTCQFDAFCPRNLKCCSTECGGAICVRPTRRSRNQKFKEKPGTCPSTDDWVCSSTCAIDTNCPGTKKCCKTEGCGGYICLQPED